ncbi:MAG TPA: MFS transporter [Gammaproteobacteria bacterium]|nr:MFS transporter [Gammaproteobacteria bacterium]
MNTGMQSQRGEVLKSYLRREVLAILLLGFSAGLPYLLIFSTLSAWLRDAGVSRTVIGYFAWVGITLSVKFLWAPVVDCLPLPWLDGKLGRRRSWLLISQILLAVGLLAMAATGPVDNLPIFAVLALVMAFSSATQDVCIDAWRIEIVSVDLQGIMSSTYIIGYRLAMIVSGAVALYLAQYFNWSFAYAVMSSCMLVGVMTTLWIREPARRLDKETDIKEDQTYQMAAAMIGLFGDRARFLRWFSTAVISPFTDFFSRNGLRKATMILSLVALYKLSDISMMMMANPLYLDLGFSKVHIANITKIYGILVTIFGAVVSGMLIVRYGLRQILLMGAILVSGTSLLFAWLAGFSAEIWVFNPGFVDVNIEYSRLLIVITGDNFSNGFAATALVAYMSSLTNRAYTATQFALFSSFMTLPGKIISGFSGRIVDSIGYELFFIYVALLGLPAIILCVMSFRYPDPSVKPA